jgi:hypothetical protein
VENRPRGSEPSTNTARGIGETFNGVAPATSFIEIVCGSTGKGDGPLAGHSRCTSGATVDAGVACSGEVDAGPAGDVELLCCSEESSLGAVTGAVQAARTLNSVQASTVRSTSPLFPIAAMAGLLPVSDPLAM